LVLQQDLDKKIPAYDDRLIGGYMKRFFAVCVFSLTVGMAAFADHPNGWGVGLVGQGNFNFLDIGAPLGGPALSLKAPSLPLYWGIGLRFGGDSFGLGVTGDYYFFEGLFVPLTEADGFGYFIGLGGYAGFHSWSWNDGWGNYGQTNLFLGARVPFGVNVVIPISSIKLEVFVDAAFQLGLGFFLHDDNAYWNGRDYEPIRMDTGVITELGVRVWF
jgi:hypothetical protein